MSPSYAYEVAGISLISELFAKRRASFRWGALAPAAVAFVFSAMALEDGGLAGAVPYIVVVLLSILYIVRPMFVLWAPPFVGFVVYSVLVLANPGNGPLSEWAIFCALGIVPTVLLWFARPKSEA